MRATKLAKWLDQLHLEVTLAREIFRIGVDGLNGDKKDRPKIIIPAMFVRCGVYHTKIF